MQDHMHVRAQKILDTLAIMQSILHINVEIAANWQLTKRQNYKVSHENTIYACKHTYINIQSRTYNIYNKNPGNIPKFNVNNSELCE